jgi:hypothetical protein
MSRPERMVRNFCDRAGVVVNGIHPWDIQVTDRRFYARALRDKSLGFGEAYMEGWWECERIDELVTRLLKAELDYRGGYPLLSSSAGAFRARANQLWQLVCWVPADASLTAESCEPADKPTAFQQKLHPNTSISIAPRRQAP